MPYWGQYSLGKKGYVSPQYNLWLVDGYLDWDVFAVAGDDQLCVDEESLRQSALQHIHYACS
jgi:hypothetical protein